MDTTYSGRSSRIVAPAASVVFALSVLAACTAGRPAAEPDTAPAARAAASEVLGNFDAGHPGKVWDRLTDNFKREVDRGTWVAVYRGCRHASFTWQAGAATLGPGGQAARVTVLVDSYPIQVTLKYAGGRWRYEPASLSMFAAGSVAADIAADDAAQICS